MSVQSTEQHSIDPKLLAAVIAFLVVVLAAFLIQVPAQGGDTWGLWFFARLVWEEGTFPLYGRSPLYVLFTSAFWPLGYPLGPAAMRFADAVIIFSGLFALSRCYLGAGFAAIIALLWLPGLLELEGIPKSYAVSAFCWALAFRHGARSPARTVYSYAFLIAACMFRINFIVVLLAAAGFDIVRALLADKPRSLISAMRPPPQILIIVALVALMGIFSALKSDHRWNNAYFANDKWLGVEGGSVESAAQIGALVHWLIAERYDGDFDNNDIYVVANRDLPEFKSTLDIFKYPDVLMGRIYSNKQIVSIVARITDLGEVLFKLGEKAGHHALSYPVFYAIFLFGGVCFYRRFVAPGNKRPFFEMLAAVAIVTGPMAVAWPSADYFYQFAPLLAFAGIGLGVTLSAWFGRFVPLSAPIRLAVMLLPVLAFTNAASSTGNVLADAFDAASWQRPHLVREVFDGHFDDVRDLTGRCNGILMTTGYGVLAAFSDRPADSIYSIFEIPPFGHLGEPPYDGLNPGRIDCVFVEKGGVQRGLSTFTTTWSRYENYLVPYIAALKGMGAKTFVFGADENYQLVVLNPPD